MSKLTWALLIAATILLALWIYSANEPPGIDEKRLELMEESQEELQSSIGELFEMLEDLEKRVEYLERRSLKPVELSSDSKAEGVHEADSSSAESRTRAEVNYTVLEDGTLVFEEGAEIELKGGHVVSSPTGLMRSDAEGTMIYGDLVVEGPDGQRIVRVALITDPGGNWAMILKDHQDLRDLNFENLKTE